MVEGLVGDIAVSILLDSGALAGNFISQDLYDKYKSKFKLKPCDKVIYLAKGNKSPSIHIKQLVQATITLIHNSTICKLHTSLYIMDMQTEIIIGLDTLVGDGFHFFITLLNELHTKHVKQNEEDDRDLSEVYSEQEYVDLCCFVVAPYSEETPKEGTYMNVFPGHDPDNLSEEVCDEDIPLPTLYPDNMMSSIADDYEEKVREYIQSIPVQVDPEFLKYPGVSELLHTTGKKVFVADNWTGLKDRAITLEWVQDPGNIKPPTRYINPKLFDGVKHEIEHMVNIGYIVPSSSNTASALVVAPKATAPFIRLCGDYVTVNKYLKKGNWLMPNIKNLLHKISGNLDPQHPSINSENTKPYTVYADLDMQNSFHQFLIDEISSERLSFVTPFGQFRPRFLPEGCSPASFLLQRNVEEIFKGFESFSIIAYDNFLILARCFDDLIAKLKLFFQRCIEHNLFLKFSKSFIGVSKVHFFGYEVDGSGYKMAEKRVIKIKEIPFPGDHEGSAAAKTQRMRIYLGSANFFSGFVPNYAEKTAFLTDMVHSDFNWNSTTWKKDYRAIFEQHKLYLSDSFKMFYPDYDLEWILRVDASELGVGAVLLQVRIVNGERVYEPLNVVSKKFSAAARRWATIQQEAFAIYYGILQNSYLLRCKCFVLETDHKNLVYIHKSVVPKIIRIRAYIASFSVILRHIPESQNKVADHLSRAFHDDKSSISPSLSAITPSISDVHNSRSGHLGIRRTWDLLNKCYPGHSYSLQDVTDHIKECVTCQTTRQSHQSSLQPLVKTLHTSDIRAAVAIDTLTIEKDKSGNQYILTIINMFSKLLAIYPVKNKDALTTAQKLFVYVCTYGLVSCIHSDNGSDFMSEVVHHLEQWLGIHRTTSLAYNPQSDGAEPVNREILRHLRAICCDEDVRDSWSDEHVYPVVQLIINEQKHAETGGFSPIQLTYGSADASYFSLPEASQVPSHYSTYIDQLNSTLQAVRAASLRYQQSVKTARMLKGPQIQNTYKVGDYVLVMLPKERRNGKLSPVNAGPFIVKRHDQGTNWVEVQNLVHGNITTFDVKDLIIFVGSSEDALAAARYDNSHYVVKCIKGYRGNPEIRSEMLFLVEYEDSDTHWLTFKEIQDTIQFEEFCRLSKLPIMRTLLISAEQAKKDQSSISKVEISATLPNTHFYCNIRTLHYYKYDQLTMLPNHHTSEYYVAAEYGNRSRNKLSIQVRIPLFHKRFEVSNYYVVMHGSKTSMNSDETLITQELIQQYHISL